MTVSMCTHLFINRCYNFSDIGDGTCVWHGIFIQYMVYIQLVWYTYSIWYGICYGVHDMVYALQYCAAASSKYTQLYSYALVCTRECQLQSLTCSCWICTLGTRMCMSQLQLGCVHTSFFELVAAWYWHALN